MKKGTKKKQEIQNITKELILHKGYSAVTMSDVSQRLNLSVGGLYYHYHSIEEIFIDIMASETGDVWKLFNNVSDTTTLLEAIADYFKAEKQDLLNFENTLNAILYDYYFSVPLLQRKEKLQADFNAVGDQIAHIITPFIKDPSYTTYICNHILVGLHGLNILAMGGSLTEQVIDYEFEEIISVIKRYIIMEED